MCSGSDSKPLMRGVWHEVSNKMLKTVKISPILSMPRKTLFPVNCLIHPIKLNIGITDPYSQTSCAKVLLVIREVTNKIDRIPGRFI